MQPTAHHWPHLGSPAPRTLVLLLGLVLVLAAGCSKKKKDEAPGAQPTAGAPSEPGSAPSDPAAPPAEPVKESSEQGADGSTVHTAAIAQKGLEKTFTVKGVKGKLLELSLTNAPATTSEVDYQLELLDPAGKRVHRLRDHDGADGTTVIELRAYLAAEGDYTVRVTDVGDDDVDPKAGFKLTTRLVADPDKNEPNNGPNLDSNRALATALAEEPIKGVLEYLGDEDWYRFEGKKNTVVELLLTNAPATSSRVDYTMELWDADGDGRLMRERHLDGAKGTTVIKTRRYIAADGPHFLRVYDWDRDEYETSAAYTLTLRQIEEIDPNEPNNAGNIDGSRALATPLADGTAVTGRVEYEADEDWFKITVDEGKLLALSLTNAPATSSPVDYTMELWGAEGDDRRWRLRNLDGSKGTTVTRTVARVEAAGEYFLRIYDWDSDDYDGAKGYTLTASVMDDPDKNEPNAGSNFDASKAVATKLPAGKSLVGYLQYRGDSDWFALEHEGGELKVTLTNAPATASPVDYTIALHNDKGERLARERDLDGSDGTTTLTLTKELPKGSYYLRVFDWDNDDFAQDATYSVAIGAEAKPVPAK